MDSAIMLLGIHTEDRHEMSSNDFCDIIVDKIVSQEVKNE